MTLKYALFIGGTSGIGKALVKKFVNNNYVLGICELPIFISCHWQKLYPVKIKLLNEFLNI